MNTYTKLKSGEWGVRVPGTTKPNPGDKVQINTKSGKTKTETIKRVAFFGKDRQTGQDVSVCEVVPRDSQPREQGHEAPPSQPQQRSSVGGIAVTCPCCGASLEIAITGTMLGTPATPMESSAPAPQEDDVIPF